MERLDALYKASEIARSMVTINNALMDNSMATYQPERDWVQFYLYDAQGERWQHFQFEAVRDGYVIHDMMASAERWRGNSPERALSTWASHILGYVTGY